MAHTTCCVLIESEKLLSPFGRKPLISWTLEALQNVRGVNKTVYLVHPLLVPRLGKLVPAKQVVKMSPGQTAHALDRWVEANLAADSDIVLFVQPASPFLPAGKIEACLDAVRRRQVDEALTVVEITVKDETGRPKKAEAATPAGCRAISLKALRDVKPRKQLQASKGVLVSLTESVDVRVPDQARIAYALLGKAGSSAA